MKHFNCEQTFTFSPTNWHSKLRSCCCMLLNVFAWFPAFCKDDTSKHLFKPLLSLQWHKNTDSMSSRRIKTERFRGSHVQTVRLCAPEIQPCHELLFCAGGKSVCVMHQRVSWGGQAAGQYAEGHPRACTAPDSPVWSVRLQAGRDLQPRTGCGKDPPAKED